MTAYIIQQELSKFPFSIVFIRFVCFRGYKWQLCVKYSHVDIFS